ncbi:hypothetical protein LTR27_005965 [Elasticomyces elasticus]|nr:hypothetical protein LTR27_005965 [Elasticomyces elasticus]
MHRHFELDSKERLVNVENVGMPWHMDRARADLLPSVVPTQWQFCEDGIVPTEFTHLSTDPLDGPITLDPESDDNFLLELRDLLGEKDLLRYLGVGLLEPDGKKRKPPVEFTEGRASIALPFQIDLSKGTPPEVSWYFDPDPFVKRGCTRCCHVINGGHLVTHSKTA